MNTRATSASESTDLLGHPIGVYVCFFTEMWERFSFCGMKALLLLYLTKYHLFGDNAGLDVLGAYAGLVYCVPVIGGVLADRWLGMRKAVVFGGILLVLGHLGMAFEGHAARSVDGIVVRDENALWVMYASLAFIIMGVGFLKPNISTIVGKLYVKDDPRRDSGFSLFYAGINLGALFSSLICGYLGETYGWRYGFGAAGIGMIAGLIMFLWGQRYLHGHAEPSNSVTLKNRKFGITLEWRIYLFSLAAIAPLAWLMWASANAKFALGGEVSLALLLMLIVLVVVLVWFVWFITTQCTATERKQMLMLMALITTALIFFTLYEQTYGSWVTFTDRMLTKDILPTLVTEHAALPWSIASLAIAPLAFVLAVSLGAHARLQTSRIIFVIAAAIVVILLLRDMLVLPQTAGSLTYLASFFLVIFAPLFAWLWAWLDRYKRNPSALTKSSIGMLFAGLSFIPLIMAAQLVGEQGVLASVWWLVLAYAILELGEMCLAPVGLSAVTRLAVPKVVNLMMGTWFLATAFSEALAALFGKLAALDVEDSASFDMAAASSSYSHLFWIMCVIGILSGLIGLGIAWLLKLRARSFLK